ncbi:MAG: threonine/serine dehydratase [Nitratireductor sp.]|nr:threonine/serine dehydratase [Nitratireductor sp.]
MIIPTLDDVVAAAGRLAGKAVRTPLLNVPVLDEQLGFRLFLKPENLQRTGSFKFRGAYNALSCIEEARRASGVVACSSGNHAQGVAEAARILSMKATIVMPSDAPAIKVERTRRSGADVVLYDRENEDRDAIANDICARDGATFVHPYDNPLVIAGQGTCGLEIAQDLELSGISPDHVLVCTGGGGLTAGVALAIHASFAGAAIHSCEPVGFDDYRRSLEVGRRLANAKASGSACDAILTPSPGEISFAINSALLGQGYAVSDAEAFHAMRIAFNEFKCVGEPGGSVALATALANGREFAGKTVVAILSGGNVDPDLFARVLGGTA